MLASVAGLLLLCLLIVGACAVSDQCASRDDGLMWLLITVVVMGTFCVLVVVERGGTL